MRWAILCAVVGCGGAEAMSLPPPAQTQATPATSNAVGFSPGETMTFDVKFGGVTAGEAELAVGEIGLFDGHRAVVVRSRIATSGAIALIKKVVDEATTTIDLDTGRPLQLDTVVEMGDKLTTAQAKFTGSIANVTYTRGG